MRSYFIDKGQRGKKLLFNNESMLESEDKDFGENTMFYGLTQKQEEVISKVFGTVNDKSKSEVELKKEAFENAQVIFELFKTVQKNELSSTARELEEAAIDRVKNEIATKDYVGKKVAELRTELKGDIAELKGDIAELRTELKLHNFYFIGLAILIVIFSPQVYDLVSKALSVAK